ncbi:TraM recognition domain-containing protein, partial [Actinocrinis puniceicyclus]
AYATAPLLNKLRAFLLRDFVLKTVATGATSIDMGAVLDGGVCLVRLPKGVLGDETVRLLGSFIVAKVWQAAAARARLGQPRHDCSLVIDECHNFLTLPIGLEEMLAEARAYRLALILAHQDLAQLPTDLREGISANARSKLIFSVSPEDARLLERHTLPALGAHDLS